MNCPMCNVELKMADRQGVEVNYCPKCRGVWIDQGGLDKIIDRSAATAVNPRREPSREHNEWERHDEHEHEGHRRKSFLSNLFD